ncbi:UAA transporter [Mycoblastus sanguinarius]|nr:UAA transporter [Mycoblastus sanguinarius]
MEEKRDSNDYHDLSGSSEDERPSISTESAQVLLMEGQNPQSGDIEAQPVATAGNAGALEYSIPTKIKCFYLTLYFALNLTLTLYNKAVLGKFSFPWLLTTLHTASASLGCYVLMRRGHFTLTKLNTRENLVLAAFSLLFTINIAISNVSLAMVSVPFHQIMRSICPIFTILLYRVYYLRSYSWATYLSLIPVVLGVGLATYGDYYFTTLGFIITLLGVLLSSLKTVMSNRLMTGTLALPALEIVLRMSPLAAVQSLLYAIATGEGRAFLRWVADGNLTPSYGSALVGNGFLALLLNISSFHTNKLAGALTITVCANLKQCMTILLGIVLFNVTVGVWNGLGMLMTLMGAAIYSKVELDSKGKAEKVVAREPLVRDEVRDVASRILDQRVPDRQRT